MENRVSPDKRKGSEESAVRPPEVETQTQHSAPNPGADSENYVSWASDSQSLGDTRNGKNRTSVKQTVSWSSSLVSNGSIALVVWTLDRGSWDPPSLTNTPGKSESPKSLSRVPSKTGKSEMGSPDALKQKVTKSAGKRKKSKKRKPRKKKGKPEQLETTECKRTASDHPIWTRSLRVTFQKLSYMCQGKIKSNGQCPGRRILARVQRGRSERRSGGFPRKLPKNSI